MTIFFFGLVPRPVSLDLVKHLCTLLKTRDKLLAEQKSPLFLAGVSKACTSELQFCATPSEKIITEIRQKLTCHS